MLFKALCESMEQNFQQKIITEDGVMTYQEVLAQANLCSEKLKGHKYGIYCKKKINVIIALLACLKAKKTAVLLCPEYGQAFNERIRKQTNLENFIYDSEADIQIVTKEIDQEEQLEQVALIIHTSGSTGNAKGVMLSQENILTNIQDALEYYPIDPESVVLICKPIYHTITVICQMITGLIVGAKLILTEEGCSALYLLHVIEKYQVTHITLTPSFWCMLLGAAKGKERMSSVVNIGIGGECATKASVKMIQEKFSDRQIFHAYGMTEGSPRITYLPPEDFGKDFRCVGKALKHVTIGILDQGGNYTQKPDVCGEILVKGPNIMKGYYNDKQATERVLKDGWYHTGDRGYMDQRGYLYILGRKDGMVIRNGVNIWLSDIEEELLKQENILDVYVCTEPGEQVKIKAYLVCRDRNITSLDMAKWCNQHLPRCSVPDRIIIVDKLEADGTEKRNIQLKKMYG